MGYFWEKTLTLWTALSVCFKLDERIGWRDKRFLLTNARTRASNSFSEHLEHIGAPFIALSAQF